MRPAWRGDGCVATEGNSAMDRWGCPDSDGDGWSDPTTHWLASPGGIADAWPADETQWHDRDGDGRGDNPKGITADVCPDVPGTSQGPTAGGDRWGCHDTDGDGWSNQGIGSHTNQPNGGIWMAMDSEITPMDTKATLAPMREASLSLIILDVEIQTAMAGQTPLKIG